MKPFLTRRQSIKILASLSAAVGLPVLFFIRAGSRNYDHKIKKGATMKLPTPDTEGRVPVERAIKGRRTVRSFRSRPLSQRQLAQLLWAAQGITGPRGFLRAAPSAGALYPMDVYAVTGSATVTELEAGVYHYSPSGHKISLVTAGDLRTAIARASLAQMWMAEPALVLVITAEYDRITGKYGRRGVRYAMIEAGHIGQNIFLQAGALGLAAGIVGAFRDEEVTEVMKVPTSHQPLLIMPVGFAA
jgi:SagB-type dehydrogenase family enzyme